jgi:hypothetical protein
MHERHVVSDGLDVPAARPLVDRRRIPDRRAAWRGGRRDSDWVNRPQGTLAQFNRPSPARTLRRVAYYVMHLW